MEKVKEKNRIFKPTSRKIQPVGFYIFILVDIYVEE